MGNFWIRKAENRKSNGKSAEKADGKAADGTDSRTRSAAGAADRSAGLSAYPDVPAQDVLPTVLLRGLSVLPGMVIHFDLTREKSVRAVEQAM